jgi:hypothetical protein
MAARTAGGGITYRTVATKKAESMGQWFTSDMSIKVNPALSIHSRYRIGGWAPAQPGQGPGGYAQGALVASRNYVKTADKITESMSPCYWEYFRIKGKLPFANISIGKRPSSSILAINANAFNSDSESIYLGAPYGPLSLGLSFYLGRPLFSYYNGFDGGGTRTFNFSFGPAYSAGPMSCYLGWDYIKGGQGGESGGGFNNPDTIGPNTLASSDGTAADYNYSAYYTALQYNNGRFFFNAEAQATYEHTLNTSQDAAGNIVYSNNIHADNEDYGYGVEFGTFIGPSKLSLIYLHDVGGDRRGNAGGDRGSLFRAYNAGNTGMTAAFEPYSFLMGISYGFGSGNTCLNGYGQMLSGTFLGARLDYAVAANLNLYGTYSVAYQPYKHYGWGYIRPDANGYVQFGRIEAAAPGAITERSAAIPVDDLGWEFDVGIDWQLLEGLLFATRFAYWQPGEWFKYACVDKATATADFTANATDNDWLWNNGGGTPQLPNLVNPDRNIDPVISLVTNVSVNY